MMALWNSNSHDPFSLNLFLHNPFIYGLGMASAWYTGAVCDTTSLSSSAPPTRPFVVPGLLSPSTSLLAFRSGSTAISGRSLTLPSLSLLWRCRSSRCLSMPIPSLSTPTPFSVLRSLLFCPFKSSRLNFPFCFFSPLPYLRKLSYIPRSIALVRGKKRRTKCTLFLVSC